MDLHRLRELPLFSSLTDEELETVAESAQEVTIEEGKILTFQNEYAYKLFVLLEGRASVWQESVHVRDLGPGDFFGEIGLLESEKRTATVTSETKVRLIVLMGWDVREIDRRLPQVAEHIRAKVQERLDADRRR